jgi:response regulator RpfG family c-di-GMP phosphodiesterase
MSHNIRKFIKTYDNIVQINTNDKKQINVQTLVNKKANHPHIYNNSINLDYHKIKCRVRVKHNPKSFKPYQYSISIVDRDRVYTNSLEEELCKMGFKVMVFNNTDEAVDKIYQDNTSLILLDANMTTYMGEDFLKMVYDKYDKIPTEIYRLIPVILTSPYIDKTIVNKMLYHKFRDFIIKPFSINDLIKKLVTNLY